jgi:hypothetical protein
MNALSLFSGIGGRSERCGGRFLEPGLGGVVDGLPRWLDGYWDAEPDVPRIARGVPNRVDRLRALGNAVVPAQAYAIFRAIMEVEKEERDHAKELFINNIYIF